MTKGWANSERGWVMGDLVGGGNAILLLLTAMMVVGTGIVAVLAARRKELRVARTFLGAGAIIAVAYAGGVIAASAASTERTLASGETKWFCGFYLDCHLGLSLDKVEMVTELPGQGVPLQARGNFHILTLQLHNSAKNPNIDMLLYRPDVRIVDASGTKYERSADAEAVLAYGIQAARPPILAAETKVTHQPTQATIAFDLPANVQGARLIVTEGWIVDKVIELGLINDENSIFHQRTYIALDSNDARTAMR